MVYKKAGTKQIIQGAIEVSEQTLKVALKRLKNEMETYMKIIIGLIIMSSE